MGNVLLCSACDGAGGCPGCAAPEAVSVVPEASDARIAGRLQRILKSTGWFASAHVSVHDGVVFLDGITSTQEHRS